MKHSIAVCFFLFVVTTASAQTLRIYHIDVEQGDATLIISPSGRTLLIDSGKNTHGHNRIAPLLTQIGVSRLDHVVTTHYHEDHYGGIDELASNPAITIGQAYDRGDKQFLPASKLSEQNYQNYDQVVGANAIALTRGHRIPLDPSMQVTCVATGGAVLGEEPPVHGHDENDMSVALLIQYGSFRYFIGGDIGLTAEGKLAARDLVMDVDAYQANHHGSHTSSLDALMRDMQPTVIVISNGNHGGYMHPRQHTLNTFDSLSPTPTVFQTNKYLKGNLGGNVADAFIADVESRDTDGTILMTVDLHTNQYAVSYPNHAHTFNIKSQGTTTAQMVITALLPDPTTGPDHTHETVTVRNDSNADINLTGWTLDDDSGRVWSLTSLGTLAAGAGVTAQRHRQPMSLNNNGDTISLRNDQGVQRDSFTYNSSQPGVVINTGH